MTPHTPAHPAHQHWLYVGGSNYSDYDHFPDMDTTQCSLIKLCSKQTQPRLQAYLHLQLHIRSCKKSDDIIPVKRTGSRHLFPFCTCCLKDGSLGGIRERGKSLFVANLTRNMLRSWWHDLNFPLGSYKKDTAGLAAFIVVSKSALVSETKSDNSSCDVFKIL